MLLDILDVVTTVALLYIIASGLFVVFGVMSVINLSHGAFIVLGAYTSIVVTGVAINPWWNFVLAPAVGFVFGAAIEFIVIRRLYARSLDTILATWGLSIIVVQVITIIFGREAHFSDAPIHGFVELGDLRYSAYRLVIVGIAVALVAALAIFSRFTEYGLVARAVILNENLAAALGINTQRVQTDHVFRRRRIGCVRRSGSRSNVEHRSNAWTGAGDPCVHDRVRCRSLACWLASQRNHTGHLSDLGIDLRESDRRQLGYCRSRRLPRPDVSAGPDDDRATRSIGQMIEWTWILCTAHAGVSIEVYGRPFWLRLRFRQQRRILWNSIFSGY